MIYYVEDDRNIRELALYALRQAGLEARGFPSATPFLEACASEPPSLILLDIMLPGIDGLELLAQLRSDERLGDIPIMMLTAKGTEYDKVVGLDAGADDYLAKPFGMMELVSRCNALLRMASRSSSAPLPASGSLCCGCIVVDASAHEAYANGVLLDLTLKEYDLLCTLLRERGHALSRGQLLELVWNVSFAGETRTVDTHVQTLRRKLNEASPGAGDLVQTVRGVGYRMKAMPA